MLHEFITLLCGSAHRMNENQAIQAKRQIFHKQRVIFYMINLLNTRNIQSRKIHQQTCIAFSL